MGWYQQLIDWQQAKKLAAVFKEQLDTVARGRGITVSLKNPIAAQAINVLMEKCPGVYKAMTTLPDLQADPNATDEITVMKTLDWRKRPSFGLLTERGDVIGEAEVRQVTSGYLRHAGEYQQTSEEKDAAKLVGLG